MIDHIWEHIGYPTNTNFLRGVRKDTFFRCKSCSLEIHVTLHSSYLSSPPLIIDDKIYRIIEFMESGRWETIRIEVALPHCQPSIHHLAQKLQEKTDD
jgi:hypothetical protein